MTPLIDPPADTTPARKFELREHAIARLRERCDQRDILVQTNGTRYRLAAERRHLRREMKEARLQAEAEEAWLRGEALAMLAAGWTGEEMREIGFSRDLLRSLGCDVGGGEAVGAAP